MAASSVESPQAGAGMGHRAQCRPNSCGMRIAQVTIPIGLPATHGRRDTKEGPTQTDSCGNRTAQVHPLSIQRHYINPPVETRSP